MRKILITAPVHDLLRASFSEKGFEVIYEPAISYAEVKSRMPELTGLVVTTRIKADKELLREADKLKWIGRLGSGMELIDVEFAEEKNIRCFSTPEGNRNAVAEHALGMLLAAMNNIVKANREARAFRWLRDENRGSEISGSVIGLIGYGNTGSAFAKLLSSFDVTLLANDKFKSGFGGTHVREADIDQICRYANIISFHVPLTADTFGMANDLFFSSLKQKPFIINTSRGEVINEDALLKALKTERISGAALDVLENEKQDLLTDAQRERYAALHADDRVLITPHIAGYSEEAFRKMGEVLLYKLATAGLV